VFMKSLTDVYINTPFNCQNFSGNYGAKHIEQSIFY